MSDTGSEAMHPWLEDQAVRDAIPDVEKRMLEAVGSTDASFDEISRWLIRSGGKRLRPALLLLTARTALCGRQRRDVIGAAAAVELIHVASLHHDDVMDRADLRRGSESVNGRWGSPVASFTGTFVLARAMSLINELGHEAATMSSEHCAALCLGQLRETENAFNTAMTIEEHLQILEGKTVALFVLAASLGALIAGRSAGERSMITDYCRHLGLAFQLRDDVLDYHGSTEALGKRAGSDFREGTYTLPVLLHLARGDAAAQELELILRLRQIGEADIARAIACVLAGGAVEEAARRARSEAANAEAAITCMADTVLRTSLVNLARLSVERIV